MGSLWAGRCEGFLEWFLGAGLGSQGWSHHPAKMFAAEGTEGNLPDGSGLSLPCPYSLGCW